MITITYFGNLKQLQPTGTESLEWQEASTDALLDLLRQRSPEWAEALAPERIFKIAINQQLQHTNAVVKDGDRVAILPPVTGG